MIQRRGGVSRTSSVSPGPSLTGGPGGFIAHSESVEFSEVGLGLLNVFASLHHGMTSYDLRLCYGMLVVFQGQVKPKCCFVLNIVISLI